MEFVWTLVLAVVIVFVLDFACEFLGITKS